MAVILLRAALLCKTDLFRTEESLNSRPDPNAFLISFGFANSSPSIPPLDFSQVPGDELNYTGCIEQTNRKLALVGPGAGGELRILRITGCSEKQVHRKW